MLMLRRAMTEIKRRKNRQRLAKAVVADRARSGVAVVAIVKGESRHLDEWVAFHRLLGVDRFYIYDNGGDGAFAATSSQLHDLVKVIPWLTSIAAVNPQVSAYCHALTNFGARHRWMAFIDVDEFLFPLKARTLPEALLDFGELSGIAVPWHMFGTSGHVAAPDDLVIASYTQRAPFPPPVKGSQLLQYKSVVDPAAVEAVGDGHWFYAHDGGRAAYTERRVRLHGFNDREPAFASSELLRLNHYFTRSEQEFEGKIARGDLQGEHFFKRSRYENLRTAIERDPVEDVDIQRFLPELRNLLEGGTASPCEY
jgi:hypothetical protein